MKKQEKRSENTLYRNTILAGDALAHIYKNGDSYCFTIVIYKNHIRTAYDSVKDYASLPECLAAAHAANLSL